MKAELNSLKFPVDLRIIFDQVEQRYNFSCCSNPASTLGVHVLESGKYKRAQKWYCLFQNKPEAEIRVLVNDLQNLYKKLKSKKPIRTYLIGR